MSVVGLSTSELESLRRRIARGEVECPLSPDLPSLSDTHARAPLLFGHERDATCALIDCVLAERQTPHPRVELVWTGPDAKASLSRDTSVVVREMFAAAQHSVLVAGYAFDHGVDILEPLHAAMRDRRVEAELFIDVPRMESSETVETHVMRFIDGFIRRNWPFGRPEPRIFYDPRTVAGDEYASIHAKCVVIDERSALVGSANFTDRGHSRNIEVGVRVDDEAFAKALARQWRQAALQGLLIRGR